MSSSTGWLLGTDNLQMVPCSCRSSVMSHSAQLGSWLTMPAQGFPRPWAHQHSSAGGCFRGTAQTLAPNGAEVRGTSAKKSTLPASSPCSSTKPPGLLQPQLHAPQKQSTFVFPCTCLAPRGNHGQDCLLETLPKPTSPASLLPRLSSGTHAHPWDWGPAGALDSGIRYRDCVQP